MKTPFLVASLLLLLPSVSIASIKIAVTVDDLPRHGTATPGVSRVEIATKMLQVFKKHNVPEVYGFINAGKIGNDAESLQVLKLWRAAGYPLANHTYSHPSLTEVSSKEFQIDIDNNEAALKELNGTADWKYFRYPFLREGESLEKRNAIRAHLAKKGYKIAQVTIDFEDWAWNEPYARCLKKGDKKEIASLRQSYLKEATEVLSKSEQFGHALFKKQISHILLLHIGSFDAEMIDDLLQKYKAMGAEFIPLSEAVKDEIYAFDPGVVWKNGSEFTYQVAKSRGITLKSLGIESHGYPEETLKNICR